MSAPPPSRTGPLLAALTAALLAGCNPCEPLDEVVVTGPDGTTRDVVQRALDDFRSWTDHPVCLRALRVGSVRGDRAKYNPANKTVEVDPDQPEPRVSTIHELCHAVDLQNGLSDEALDRFEAAGAHGGTARRRGREGFANVCQLGAVTLDLVTAVSCPAEDPVDGL